MRRLVVLVLAFAVAPAAAAAPPTLQISVAPQTGLAPLDTTLVASGDAAAYRWEIGGAAAGEGPTLRYVFPAGRHQVTVVALSTTGEETRQTVTVDAFSLSLLGPRVAAYGSKTRFSGRISPALPGARVALQHAGRVVATGRVRRGGRFAIGARPRSPGPYAVRIGDLVSRAVTVAVRPRIAVDVGSSRVVGRPLVVRVALRPRAAGLLQVQVRRPGARPFVRTGRGRLALRIRTRRAGAYRIRVSARPASGYASRTATVSVPFHVATLGPGSRGASVVELEQRLAQLGYAVRGIDGHYGYDTYEAVLAFQKVHGLAGTGRVTAAVWRRLERAGPPRPRYARGNHVEVDKRRQVLFVVRRGRVVLVSHVSTGATGNTPVGRWRVYRKVAGWDSVLWYPLYFLRGFAIHGYPSVPAYPASHGCVRVPMWLAPRLHARHPYGTVVYVY